MAPTIRHFLRNIFRKRRVEQDLDAEIRFYRETLVEQRMAAGMSEQEARRAVRLEMGSADSLKDEVRDVRLGAAMDQIWRDLRYAVRGLRNKPGFTAAAVLVLALGIGANSAVFSLVNAFLLNPLAVTKPDQLIGLYSRDTQHPDSYRAFSFQSYVEIRDDNPIFSSLMAHQFALVGVENGDRTRRVFADIVSSNYFSTLGVRLLKGRPFSVKEEKPGQELTVVMSYPFWRRTGEDPKILGQDLRIDGHLFKVIGIAPKGFTGTTALVSPTVFLPLGAQTVVRDYTGFILVGRLKPGITQRKANARLAVFASQMEKEFPAANKDRMLFVHPLSRMSVSTRPSDDSALARMPAILLMLLAGVVLLIACLNLANMMMANGTARRKEIAVRLAIGGSRARIVQQLITECFVLVILGGSAGLFAAAWSTKVLIGSLAHISPIDLVYEATPDVRVLAGTLAFCIVSTVIFGLFPAWKISKPDTWLDLKATTGEDAVVTRALLSRGNVLVIAQLSLSLMMLTAAGLFVRSAIRAADIQPGFSVQNEVLAEVDAGLVNDNEPQTRQLYRTLRERLTRIPGVQSVAMAAVVPFGVRHMGASIAPADAATPKLNPPITVRFNIVTANYFRTLGIPLLRGRPFTSAESMPQSKSHVAILDKLAAERLWPGQNPVGKHIRLDGKICEVVGLAGNVREQIFGDRTEPHVYIPLGQQYPSDMQIHLRVAGSGPDAEVRMLEAVRQEIRTTDPRLPVLELKTMRENLESNFGFWVLSTGAQMLETFGAVALFLAAIGLYGVNAYTVARRTREIGIRMALGADASSARRMILGQGLRVIAIGIAIGLLLGIAIGRLLSGFLYDTPSIDPLVLLIASAVLCSVALLACYLPARKASRVDPMVALRYE